MIRGSLAAIVLLDSIDVGLETAHTDGLQDWDSVKVSIVLIDVSLVIVVLDVLVIVAVIAHVIVVFNILLQLIVFLCCQFYLLAMVNKVIVFLYMIYTHNVKELETLNLLIVIHLKSWPSFSFINTLF